MIYNKEFVKGDGRRLVGGGPRDQQRRREIMETQALLDVDLSNHHNIKDKNIFTAEQVDEEIRKAVNSTIKEIEDKYKLKIEKLKLKVSSQKETIDTLKSIKYSVAVAEGIKNDAPKMEEVFIDPLEKDSGRKLESHIKINEEVSSEKEKMNAKVNKLRNVLGKIPLGK